MSEINVASFQNAIDSLASGLEVYKKQPAAPGDAQRQLMQAGVIQNFEFTFEQAWKLMRRWLNNNLTPGIADGVTKSELFRLAAENKLIGDVAAWQEFSAARNYTPHQYGRLTANDVAAIAAAFLPQARDLLNNVVSHR